MIFKATRLVISTRVWGDKRREKIWKGNPEAKLE